MKCSKCSGVLVASDCIKCLKCSKQFHIACSNFSELSDKNPKFRRASWLCTSCEFTRLDNKKSPNSESFSNSIDTEYNSKIDNILFAVNDIKKLISKHESLFSELNNKLDEVSNQLVDLGTRTAVLENRVTILENRVSTISKSTNSDETVISEVIDRQARSRNIIIFNLPEPIGINENDTSLIKSLLDDITPDIVPVTLSRLGQKSIKPRPIKVILHEPSDVFIILKNKHKLRTSPTYGSIRITPDRTTMQRNQIRDIIGKLEERKAAGESNLTMKFIKGIPTISKN